MNFVTDRIAVGGWSAVIDFKGLKSAKIEGVLNVAMNLDIYRGANGVIYKTTLPFDYAKIGLHDGNGNSINSMMAAFLVLEEMLSRHEKVLVNCWSGLSRSVSVVCLYMLKNKMADDFDIALDKIKKNRINAKPHDVLKKLVEECL